MLNVKHVLETCRRFVKYDHIGPKCIKSLSILKTVQYVIGIFVCE